MISGRLRASAGALARAQLTPSFVARRVREVIELAIAGEGAGSSSKGRAQSSNSCMSSVVRSATRRKR